MTTVVNRMNYSLSRANRYHVDLFSIAVSNSEVFGFFVHIVIKYAQIRNSMEL